MSNFEILLVNIWLSAAVVIFFIGFICRKLVDRFMDRKLKALEDNSAQILNESALASILAEIKLKLDK